MTPSNIIAGFHSTGICPYSRYAILRGDSSVARSCNIHSPFQSLCVLTSVENMQLLEEKRNLKLKERKREETTRTENL